MKMSYGSKNRSRFLWGVKAVLLLLLVSLLVGVNPVDAEAFTVGKTVEVNEIQVPVLGFTRVNNSTDAEFISLKMEYEAAVGNILSGIDPSWTQVQKALYIHDAICNNADYAFTPNHTPDFDYKWAYDNLVRQKSICNGYADAFFDIATRAGIENYRVFSERLDHAWNMVVIDGKQYYIDCTWDGQERGTGHYYFLNSYSFCWCDHNGGVDDWTYAGVTEGTLTLRDDTEYNHVEWAVSFPSETSISLNRDYQIAKVGDTVKLTATVGSSGAALPQWVSSDPSVATVDSNGNVRVVGYGSSFITAISGTARKTCLVMVPRLCFEEKTIHIDQSLEPERKVTVSLTPSEERLPYKHLYWKSSDPAVADVTAQTAVQDGIWAEFVDCYGLGENILIPKGPGTAVITVSSPDGKYTDSFTVTVTASLQEVTFREENLKLFAGKTEELQYVLTPSYATGDLTARWTSSDPSVVTVDQKGKVTAVSAGVATVTLTIQGKTASCEIEVLERSGGMAEIWFIDGDGTCLYSDFRELAVGGTVQLTGFYRTSDYRYATPETAQWTSSDPSVATVSADGLVTARKPGETVITAAICDARDDFYIYVLDDGEESYTEPSYDPATDYPDPYWYLDYGLSDQYVPSDYQDKSGSPMILEGQPDCSWNYAGGKAYWYEGGIKQGTYYDPKGVIGDGTNRGREICDVSQDAWFWLDSCFDGAKAVGKEVWIPYIYQNEDDWDINQRYNISRESDPGMEDLVLSCMNSKSGKWVRYDENGRMCKGWITIEGALAEIYPDQVGNVYYYDNRTGLMAKGLVTIEGVEHYFDEISGVMQY